MRLLLVLTAAAGALLLLPGATMGTDLQCTHDKPAISARVDVSVDKPTHERAVFESANDLVGLTVQNRDGEKLGKIVELVFDPLKGQIRYAALSYGGLLGMGNKLFAVPWNALMLHEKDGKAHHFVLDIAKDRLKEAPGFDKDNWPDLANPEWSGKIEKFYGTEHAAVTTEEKAPGTRAAVSIVGSHDLIGRPFRDAASDNVGEVKDLVLDLRTGVIHYAVVDLHGIEDTGGKLFAVPWSAVGIFRESGKDYFVLNMDKDTLRGAPGFTKDKWPDFASTSWQRTIDEFYRPVTAGRPAPTIQR